MCLKNCTIHVTSNRRRHGIGERSRAWAPQRAGGGLAQAAGAAKRAASRASAQESRQGARSEAEQGRQASQAQRQEGMSQNQAQRQSGASQNQAQRQTAAQNMQNTRANAVSNVNYSSGCNNCSNWDSGNVAAGILTLSLHRDSRRERGLGGATTTGARLKVSLKEPATPPASLGIGRPRTDA
jgi:hypothetical protein